MRLPFPLNLTQKPLSPPAICQCGKRFFVFYLKIKVLILVGGLVSLHLVVMVMMVPVAMMAVMLTLLLGQRFFSPQLPSEPFTPSTARVRKGATLRALIAVRHGFRHWILSS